MNEMKPEYFAQAGERKKNSVGHKVAWALAILGVVAACVAIAAPVFFSAQSSDHGYGGACKDNLRTIDGTIMQYRAGHDDYCLYTSGYVPTYLKEWPSCPTDDRPYVIVWDGPGGPPHAYCPNGHTY